MGQGADGHSLRSWLVPLAAMAMIGIAGLIADNGLPPGPAGPATIAMLVVAAVLSVVALSPRVNDLRVVVPALVGAGLCGAGVDWWSDGGFVIGYVTLVGLALRAPRRIAIPAAAPAVATIAVAEAHDSPTPATTIMSVLLGFGFLFITSAFAAVSLQARLRAEAKLAQEAALRAQEAATSEARERAAMLAERSRLARELHDVLAYSLAALTLQLEGARLMAAGAGAGARLMEQITAAHRLARVGMLNARHALLILREDETPGLAGLPDLVSQCAAASGIPIELLAEGVPQPLPPEAGLTVYRTVQEALTNIAKHAGRGASAEVRLTWTPDELEVAVTDSGGDSVDAGLPSSGFGLTGMAQRAAQHGGRLDASRGSDGFTVRLRLPLRPGPRERSDVAC